MHKSSGIVKVLRSDRGFGFLVTHDYPHDIFFVMKDVKPLVKECKNRGLVFAVGLHLKFDVIQVDRGLQATNIELEV